jgi:hypothetical protein
MPYLFWFCAAMTSSQAYFLAQRGFEPEAPEKK